MSERAVDALISSTPRDGDRSVAEQYKDGLLARSLSSLVVERPSADGGNTSEEITAYRTGQGAYLDAMREAITRGVGGILIIGASLGENGSRTAWHRNMGAVAATVELADEHGLSVLFDSYPTVQEATDFAGVTQDAALKRLGAVQEILGWEPKPLQGDIDKVVEVLHV